MVYLAILTAAAGGILYVVFFGKKGETPSRRDYDKEREIILLELKDISSTWIDGYHNETDIADLMQIWRQGTKPATAAQNFHSIENSAFVYQRSRDFYNHYIKNEPFMAGNVGAIIKILLMRLDSSNCPSVVDKKFTTDPDSKMDLNQYDIYAKVSLLDHTLNVCESAWEECNRLSMAIMWPKALIAALGHDIGKMPEYHGELRATGDHLILSATLLNLAPEFTALPYAEEIVAAVRHHNGAGQKGDILSKILAAADKAARKKELSINRPNISIFEDAKPDNDPKDETEDEKAPAGAPILKVVPNSPPQQPDPAPLDIQKAFAIEIALQKSKAAAERAEVEAGPLVPGKVKYDLSWLPVDKTIERLKGYVNIQRKLSPNKSKPFFYAYSMPDGTVYFSPPAILDAIQEIALKNNQPFPTDPDKNLRGAILLAFADLMRGRNYLHAAMVGEGFFVGQFKLTHKVEDYSMEKVYLMPLKAEAFNITVGTFENLKKKDSFPAGITNIILTSNPQE